MPKMFLAQPHLAFLHHPVREIKSCSQDHVTHLQSKVRKARVVSFFTDIPTYQNDDMQPTQICFKTGLIYHETMHSTESSPTTPLDSFAHFVGTRAGADFVISGLLQMMMSQVMRAWIFNVRLGPGRIPFEKASLRRGRFIWLQRRVHLASTRPFFHGLRTNLTAHTEYCS